jgi:hypothetical protein
VARRRRKAALKRTQSKRWRDLLRSVPNHAKGLDCALQRRFWGGQAIRATEPGAVREVWLASGVVHYPLPQSTSDDPLGGAPIGIGENAQISQWTFPQFLLGCEYPNNHVPMALAE